MTAITTTQTTTISREAAETLHSDLLKAGKALATARVTFARLVKEVREGEAWAVLGHASWTTYVAAVMAEMPRMSKGDSEWIAGFMAGEGMSSRAVATALGVSQSTASRMIRQASEAQGTLVAVVTGTDGKEQATASEARKEASEARKVDPVSSGLAKMRKGAKMLSEADVTGMTVDEIDAALSDLATISSDFKRFAAALTLARKSATVDAAQ